MTTQPDPTTEHIVTPDMLPPEDRAYVGRLARALRCGNPGCSCATSHKFHCPAHGNPEIPTLTVSYTPSDGFSFRCISCRVDKVLEALARRGLAAESWLLTATGAQEAGLRPLAFFIPQPRDWLWPNRIPLGQLTLIAGYPASGKTSIALDIAARVSRGAPTPDVRNVSFPCAPVLLAPLNGNPSADILPVLRSLGANLDRIYIADLLSLVHPADFYPDEPPPEEAVEEARRKEKERNFYVWLNNSRKLPSVADLTAPPPALPTTSLPLVKLDAPWPGLTHVMGRLANLIALGSAALLVVDQVEDLAAMHRTKVSTILGMLKALATRSGAAVVAITHNTAPTFPRAVDAMQSRLAHASVVFTTAVVEPGKRRFLVPLRPPMSDDAPAIPFALGRHEDFSVAWRKPVFPAHLRALAQPRSNDGAKTRAAQAFITRALTEGPRLAVEVEREAVLLGISHSTLRRVRAGSGVKATRVSVAGTPSGPGAWYWSLSPETSMQQHATPGGPPEILNV